MSAWHVSDRLAAQYAEGAAAEADAWSVEKHVESCGTCASRVSSAARSGPAGQVLAEVRAAVLSRAAGAASPQTAPGRARGSAGYGIAQAQESTPGAEPAGYGIAHARELTPGSGAEAAGHKNAQTRRPTPEAAAQPAGYEIAHARELAPEAEPARHTNAHTRTPTPEAEAQPAGYEIAHARELAPEAEPARHTNAHTRTPVPATEVRVDAPDYRPARAGRRLRLGHVLWAVGPALRGAWLAALLLVALGALFLAYGAGFSAARPLLLAVSPVVPLLGVALSYGPHADPLHEIAAATPSGGLRLLLTRTAAVLAVSVPLLTAVGALLPPAADAPSAAAWLLPGLALTLGALALGSYIGCLRAAGGLAACWLGVVVAPVLASLPQDLAGRLEPYVSGPAVQGGWAAAAALCAALLAVRRTSFDHLEKS
ncbi:zf-HC2 domain-containing protein [Streptomyces sp. NPDC051907]|uniref:zf-HC2 domain-containing protein n=1 Tax=Streptomyces sp. NPDC051907 TaxID=3155284 RepID=UPI003446DA6F